MKNIKSLLLASLTGISISLSAQEILGPNRSWDTYSTSIGAIGFVPQVCPPVTVPLAINDMYNTSGFANLRGYGIDILNTRVKNINKPNIPAYLGMSVNSYDGHLFYIREDVRIMTNSIPLDFIFYYNNSSTATDLGFGPGWTMTYSMSCTPDGSNAAVVWPDGSRDYYSWNGSIYVAPIGVFDQLEQYLPGKFKLTTKYGYKYFFDNISHHGITSITDLNNNSITISYTGSLPTTITDASSRSITLSYTSGHLSQVTDPNYPGSRTWNYTYDPDGNLIKVIDPVGGDIAYQYDEVRNMKQLTDQLGNIFNMVYQNCTYVTTITSPLSSMNFIYDNSLLTTTMNQTVNSVLQSTSYKYDVNGNMIEIIGNCCGFHQQYSYDAMNNLVQRVDANGNIFVYLYDARGNRIQETDPLTNTRLFVYEPVYNRLTSYTDKRGNSTTFSYDAQGNLLQINKPLGITESYTYDVNGNRLTATDGRSFTTQYNYNANGYITQVNFPGGAINQYSYDNAGNRTSFTDANAHTTTYTYDALGRITQSTNAMSNSNLFTYDARSSMLSTTDPMGHVTSYTYDALMRKISKTTPAGTSTFTYDEAGNLLTLFDNIGNTSTYAYDTRNLLLSETDALSHTRSMTYDANGNKLSETDRRGNTTTYAYDALNRRIQTTDPLLNNTVYAYDANGNRTSMTDANSHITTSSYDALNRIIQMQFPIGTSNYSYDANNNRISTIDPNSHTTSIIYDNRNRVITVTDALTHSANYSYDAQGNLISSTNRNGHTTTYVYDVLNRQISETNPLLETTTYGYDADGKMISIVIPSGNTTTYSYDAEHRLISASDLVGALSSATYDANSNRLSQTDGLGHTTTYTYDALNRTITEVDALAKTTTMAYDNNSNLVTLTDRKAHSTTYAYDALNRRTQTTSPSGFLTATGYDAEGNLTSMTDANGRITTYAYDANDRRTLETFADGTTKSFTYDARGNLISRTDNMGNATQYVYDVLDRLVLRNLPGPNDDAYTYDFGSRMLTANNSNANISFSYDNADRKLSEIMNAHVTSYTYDIPNKKRFIIYPGGRNIEEDYDNRLRLIVIKDGGVTFVSSGYDLANRLTTQGYNNGTNSIFSYNNNDWMTGLSHAGPAAIAQFNYAYDNEGNRIYSQKNHRLTNSEAYSYDNDDRHTIYKEGPLVGSTIPSPVTQTQYNYDPAGNRTTVVKDAVTSSYNTNVVNKYTSFFDVVVTIPIYDANGNLLYDGSFNYGYDAENRLINVNSGSVATYLYDAMGRRIKKIAAGITSNFYYDGAREIEEQNASGTTIATYVWGAGTDNILNMKRGANNYYYHQDELGSVIAITNNVGSVQERYEYDAYGKPTLYNATYSTTLPATTIGNTYMFTGREYNAETGHYHYRARAYYPKWGRFDQWDPNENSYASSVIGNQYLYASNNPINNKDPFGLEDKEAKKLKDWAEKAKKAAEDKIKEELEKAKDKLIDKCKEKVTEAIGEGAAATAGLIIQHAKFELEVAQAIIDAGGKIANQHSACILCLTNEDTHRQNDKTWKGGTISIWSSNPFNFGFHDYIVLCRRVNGQIYATVPDADGNDVWVPCIK